MTPTMATIIGSIISGLVALFVASIQHSKTTALIEYRIDQLEKKVDDSNHVKERTAINERDIKTSFSRIDELRNDVNRLLCK